MFSIAHLLESRNPSDALSYLFHAPHSHATAHTAL
jgi:hypothetical protein